MAVVIDTNIIFSMLLTQNSHIREKFFESAETYYAPNYVFVELFEIKEKLLGLSDLKEVELYELLNRLFQSVHFISEGRMTNCMLEDSSSGATSRRHSSRRGGIQPEWHKY